MLDQVVTQSCVELLLCRLFTSGNATSHGQVVQLSCLYNQQVAFYMTGSERLIIIISEMSLCVTLYFHDRYLIFPPPYLCRNFIDPRIPGSDYCTVGKFVCHPQSQDLRFSCRGVFGLKTEALWGLRLCRIPGFHRSSGLCRIVKNSRIVCFVPISN